MCQSTKRVLRNVEAETVKRREGERSGIDRSSFLSGRLWLWVKKLFLKDGGTSVESRQIFLAEQI